MARREFVTKRTLGGKNNFYPFKKSKKNPEAPHFIDGDQVVFRLDNILIGQKYKKPELHVTLVAEPHLQHDSNTLTKGDKMTINSGGVIPKLVEDGELFKGNFYVLNYNGMEELPEGHANAGDMAHQIEIEEIEDPSLDDSGAEDEDDLGL